MKKVILPDNSGVEFQFDGLAPVIVKLADMAAVNRQRMACAGISQRIGDNAAISKSAENGFRVTETMRREAVMELVEHYRSGSEEWSPKAKARGPSYNPHIQAIAEKKGCSYDEAAAWFQAKLMAELGDE